MGLKHNVIRVRSFFELKHNFLTIHYIYIIASVLIGSLLIFAGQDIRYIDALVIAGGSCTGAGLNPIDLNKLNTWQQVCIFLLCTTCHLILINTVVVVVRLYWFRKRFKEIIEASNELIRTRSGALRLATVADERTRADVFRIFTLLRTKKNAGTKLSPDMRSPRGADDVISAAERRQSGQQSDAHVNILSQLQPETQESSMPSNDRQKTVDQDEIDDGARAGPGISTIQGAEGVSTKRNIRFEDPRAEQRRTSLNEATFRRIATEPSNVPSQPDDMRPRRRRVGSVGSGGMSVATAPYVSFSPTIGRNSLFIGLTEEQREELGGLEYRALKALLWILPFYFLGIQLFSWICLIPWIYRDSSHHAVLQRDAIGGTWWAIFTTASVFSNVGFMLTPDAMIPFQDSVFPLLILSFVIIAGNTGFPCLLRLCIWILYKLYPDESNEKETYKFLLDHPRRCFTLLFPKSATWWLVGVLVILNFSDLFFFLVLDIGNTYVSAIPVGYRIVDGFFQAVSTRTAGVAVTNLQLINPALLVSYLIMMYISVYPIAISIRRTNVYEEKSLGIYADEDENVSFLATHIRRQLGFDLWYVFLGLFIICIVESSQIEDTNNYVPTYARALIFQWFNIYNILFEVVSAYACVGLSIGYPTVNAAFISQFHTVSKLIIVALMIRGRHRGLPNAIDKAIMLPSPTKLEDERRPSARRLVSNTE